MKMIKKLVLVLMVAMIALTVFTSKSSAMTKNELKDYMLGDRGIAGSGLHARADDKVKIGRYIDGNEITDAQADKIKAIIDKAIDLMTKDGATHPNALSTPAKKRQLLEFAEEAADVLGLTVTYNVEEERLYVYKDGKPYEYLDWGVKGTSGNGSTAGDSETEKQGSSSPLVQTGATNYGYVAVAGVVLVAGITLAVARKNAIKVNA